MCGRRRIGEGPQEGKHLYYRCTDRIYSFPLPPKCRERGVNARIADVMVWQGVSDLMSGPKLLKKQQWDLQVIRLHLRKTPLVKPMS